MHPANVDASRSAATREGSLVHEAQIFLSYARYVAFIGLRLLGNRANLVDLVQLVLRYSFTRSEQRRDSSRESSSRSWRGRLR